MGASERTEIALALGGGTARGMAHVGALKALEAAGMGPVALAGTSFGAIIASMAALGAPPLEIERTVRRTNIMELWAQGIDFGLHRGALVHGERLTRWLDRTVFYGARIEDAERPLAIAATDLLTGLPVVLRHGPVAEAVRASCALPGVFAPVEIDGRRLVDGGFTEPVPFGALATLPAARAVGIHAGLDLAGSVALRRLRALDAGPFGRVVHRLAARRRGSTTWSRLLVGASLSLRSYRHDAAAPDGSVLVTVAPDVAWWDFHRSPIAIEAGERAVLAWLRTDRRGGVVVRSDEAGAERVRSPNVPDSRSSTTVEAALGSAGDEP